MSEDYPTDTPRTNAFEETCGDYEKPYAYTRRLAAFTRGLERELAETKKEISQLKRKYNMASQDGKSEFTSGLGICNDPEFSDGHDYEGFVGGCERFGCPGGDNCTGLPNVQAKPQTTAADGR